MTVRFGQIRPRGIAKANVAVRDHSCTTSSHSGGGAFSLLGVMHKSIIPVCLDDNKYHSIWSRF